jgi:hypothetical protein
MAMVDLTKQNSKVETREKLFVPYVDSSPFVYCLTKSTKYPVQQQLFTSHDISYTFRLKYSHHQADYENKNIKIHTCLVLRSRTLK